MEEAHKKHPFLDQKGIDMKEIEEIKTILTSDTKNTEEYIK
jgi:hypothetical protein